MGPSTQPQPELGRQAARMLTPALVKPKLMRSVDSDSKPRPGLRQMDSVDIHLNFNLTLGWQGGPSTYHKPQPDPGCWALWMASPVPVMLSKSGNPLKFEGNNPCPTHFSTNVWGPGRSTCHCRTREGYPGTQMPNLQPWSHPYLSSLSALT